MLDTVRLTETPEGIELSLRLAGPAVRALAWVTDFFIRAGLVLALSIPLNFMGVFGVGLLLIFWFLLEWFYPVIFEVKFHGATPGKKIFHLRVVQDDGGPIGWSASLIRNLLRAADFLPLCYGFGLISMLFHPDYKRLGDLAANTLVVYHDKEENKHLLPEQASLALSVPLNLEEQRSIIHFAERGQQLSAGRREELADILQPLTKAEKAQGVEKLFGIANWLVGGKS